MTTYTLRFYGFDQLGLSLVAGAPPRPGSGTGSDATALCLTGTRFALRAEEPALTDLTVEEAGPGAARLVAGGGIGLAGQPVMLAQKISLATNEVPQRRLTVHLLAIAGQGVGILGDAPLDPGVHYTVLRAEDGDGRAGLHQGWMPGRDLPKVTGMAGAGSEPGAEMALGLTHGTRIDTPEGARLVETLRPGDLVSTLDNGSQALRWAGGWHVPATVLETHAAPRPVVFAAGAFGNPYPLLVAPQHRMLLNDWRAQVYFGEDQVLVPACALVNGGTIRQVVPPDGITYCHLLFDRHEVILAEGALSESFLPDETGLERLGPDKRREIEALFSTAALEWRRAAFPVVRLAEALALRLPD